MAQVDSRATTSTAHYRHHRHHHHLALDSYWPGQAQEARELLLLLSLLLLSLLLLSLLLLTL